MNKLSEICSVRLYDLMRKYMNYASLWLQFGYYMGIFVHMASLVEAEVGVNGCCFVIVSMVTEKGEEGRERAALT